MRNKVLLCCFSILLSFMVLGCRGGGGLGGGVTNYAGPNPLYTQCHLKHRGNQITWVNWVAYVDFIPAGTPVTLQTYTAKQATFTSDNGGTYTLNFGVGSSPAHSLELIHKFIGESPPAVDPGEFQSVIDQKRAKVGMTKEQVYYAMGPPAWAGPAKTHTMNRSGIMATSLWKYNRRRFGKNLGVEFDANGIVIRTEGFW